MSYLGRVTRLEVVEHSSLSGKHELLDVSVAPLTYCSRFSTTRTYLWTSRVIAFILKIEIMHSLWRLSLIVTQVVCFLSWLESGWYEHSPVLVGEHHSSMTFFQVQGVIYRTHLFFCHNELTLYCFIGICSFNVNYVCQRHKSHLTHLCYNAVTHMIYYIFD